MSIVIYKNGERSKCEPDELQYQLGDGWSLTNEPVEKAVEAIDKPIKDDEAEIRAHAKSLGVKSSHNKKLEKVLEEIEAIENDSD